MKNLKYLPLTLLASTFLCAETSILVDFGKPDLLSSNLTDPNGYHWNNVYPPADAKNGRIGWETLTEEQKANFSSTFEEYFNDLIGLPFVMVEDMVDRDGTSTGLRMELAEVFKRNPEWTVGGTMGRAGDEYGDDLGPFPTETGYPGSATIDGFYANFEYSAIVDIVGLDNSKQYDLKMWGGLATEPATTSWSVNGGEFVTIETYLNTGDFAVFENVSPIDGKISIHFRQGHDLFKPDARWSTLEITGDFSGGTGTTDWLGYAVDENGFANTETWLGWVLVTDKPWIFVYGLEDWAYIPDDSGWIYVLK